MGYKVKPPKYGCEFWRRERRVKRAPNDEILALKEEMKEIRASMAVIEKVRVEHSCNVKELSFIMSGHRADIKSISQVTTVPPEQRRAVKTAEKKFRVAVDDNQKFTMGIYYLSRLHNQMHMRCLEIRREERENRKRHWYNI